MKKLIILLGGIGISFSPIFVRFSNTDTSLLAFYRLVIVCLILLPPLLKNDLGNIKELDLKTLVLCALSGIFFGLHLKFAFMAVNQASIAAATVLIDTEIFFVAAAERFMGSIRFSRLMLIGILVAFTGSVIIALQDLSSGTSLLLIGDLWALIAAIVSSCYTLIGKKCRKGMTTGSYTWLVYFFGLLTLGSDIQLRGISMLSIDRYNLLIALGLAIFPTLMGHSIFSWGLKYESAAYVSLVKLLEPVFATIMAVFFFHEYPALLTIIGATIVICGILSFITGEYKAPEKG